MTNAQVTAINVTTSDSSHTDFNPVVNKVMVKNIGTANCYINLNAAATTSHLRLYTGQTRVLGMIGITDVHAICDTGDSTTLKITGVIQW